MSPTPHQPSSPRTGPATSRWRRLARRAASTLMVAALGLLLWTFGADPRGPEATTVAGAWGDEAAQARPTTMADWLPMAPANACGLGASSCFKCHNGKRAGAPKADPAKSPWHAHHAKVDNSCVGCHKGNPRVMKDDVAHKNMLKTPRDDSGGSCAGCHTADLDKVKTAYASGGK